MHHKIHIIAGIIFLFINSVALSQTLKNISAGSNEKDASAPIILWPAGAPDEKEPKEEEKDIAKSEDGKVAGKEIIKLTNVSKPSITIYRPKKEKDTGAAMVVCPGGGYYILAMDLEGTEICEWLNSLGITAILLKYRVPRKEGVPYYISPLQDAQRALGLVRYNAKALGIDPGKIGVMGFSAGGHLSAALSNNFEKRIYPAIDEADKVSCRPDFTLLVYPAYLTEKDSTDRMAPELPVSSNTPTTLLIMTEDDGVRVENSLVYYLALKKANVPAEMHLYAKGGHGYGLRKSNDIISTWPARAEDWFRTIGVLRKK